MAKKVSSVSVLPGSINDERSEDHHTDRTKDAVSVVASPGQVSVEAPVFVINGYSKKRIDLTLSGREARAAKALKDGAEMREMQLPNGKYISSPTDAIKLLLNRIADEIGL